MARVEPWPGFSFGIRPPKPDETPLSWDEVAFAVRRRIVRPGVPFKANDEWDDAPVRQSWRAAGTWERQGVALLASASVWGGL